MSGFEGAVCFGKSGLFESRVREDRVRALGLCAGCPLLVRCRRDVGRVRPRGVVLAGQYFDEHGRRAVA